jgi:hypothetical protein
MEAYLAVSLFLWALTGVGAVPCRGHGCESVLLLWGVIVATVSLWPLGLYLSLRTFVPRMGPVPPVPPPGRVLKIAFALNFLAQTGALIAVALELFKDRTA